ncbi:hypothetical protein DPMN_099200 [Dreissena polymorpha]|uniref:Uncharacterized protein n=2 Tax=Dreissena polymorpha TaxID=45954 RepID=A0A9D4LF60_DREPO|nr:hypothetical protein DPMN_099200 [Dreissena polymorpha]
MTLTILEDKEEEEEEVNPSNVKKHSSEKDVTEQKSGDLWVGSREERRRRRQTEEEALGEDADTDLELDEEKSEFDVTGRATYLNACRALGVVPVSYFLRHMTDRRLSLAHHGLGAVGMKALSYSLMNNTFILALDLEDNWLCGEGGEYAAAMLKENCYITELNLANNKLGSVGCAAICRVLHANVTLRNIDMSGNDLSDKDSQTIAEAFQENNILKYVNLSHNGFGSTDSKLLADAISENETIEHLDLSWNNFRLKSATCICNGIATNGRIRVVNLAMNGLGNEGAFGVAEILKQSGTIAHIDVSHNRIGTTAATVIGKALEGNDLLKTLKIGQNPLGVEGAKSILKGIMPEASCVVELDLTEVVVDKEFRSLKQELLASRAVAIAHGPVLEDFVIQIKRKPPTTLFGTPISELTSENIMTSLKKYCDVNNIEIYDALFSYDVINDRMLVADIVKALSNVGVSLRVAEAEVLSRLLEGHTTGDGLVDISSLKI